MAIESAVIMRRAARIACLVLIFGLALGSAATAQLPITFKPGNPPPVTAGSIIPFSHGKTGVWKQIYSMRVDPLHGNVLLLDSATSTLYQLAPGASTPNLVVGPSTGNSDCSALEKNGTYWNAAIAFDKWDNLYVTDRYGSAVQFCRAPYDPSSGTWTFSTAAKWAGPTYKNAQGNQVPIPPQDLQVGDDGVTFYVSTSSTSSIFKYTVDQTGAVSNVTALATGLQTMVSQIAVDHAGNLFFVENQGSYPNNVHGIREIPAGSPTVAGDGTGSAESQLTRVDQGGWDGITGMYFDAHGNLYFSSQNNSTYGGHANGVFMIPNEGTPTSPNLVWADTIMVSPVNASYPPMVDSRGLLWIATGWYNNWAPDGSNAPQCNTTTVDTAAATCLTSTIVLWKPGAADLGPSGVGGGNNITITAYSVDSGGSTLTLTANNTFTENQVVTIKAGANDPLAALDGHSFYVANTGLSSTSFQVSTSLIAAGSSGSTSATVNDNPTGTLFYMFNKAATVDKFALAKPSDTNFTRLAADPFHNANATATVPMCTDGGSYPAFSANMITDSAYSYCTYMVQLNTPIAGPVQGEVQMIEGTSVVDGSNAYLSGVGEAPAISAVSSAALQSIASASDLNDPLQVAADRAGNTYVADHALKTVKKYPAGTTSTTSGKVLGSGLTGPTGVAVDGVGNVYIGDSGKVIEIPFVNGALANSQATIASGLGTDNLSLAVNGLGDVFVADKQKKQVVEIPNPQSTLMLDGRPFPVLGAKAGFTGPSAIATDGSGNVWVADGSSLWRIEMPFGNPVQVLSDALQAPVTGLAVDPSGSVFVAQADGIWWIPFNTATGSLNINAKVQISEGLGSGSTPAIPWGIALDGLQNLYATYGSGSTAGLSQLGIGGSINFNSFGGINPNVPFEVDAQILNVGNQPLTVADFSTYPVGGADAADFSVVAATINAPACDPSGNTSTPPGGSCYIGLVLQAPSAGVVNASVAMLSNAVNAASGVNIAMTGNVIQDLRPASQVAIDITPSSGVVYPGSVTVKVTVSADAAYGTPTGSVALSVSSANGVLPKQTLSLDSTGSATFNYTKLLGGTYNVNANYGGDGESGATQNSCSSATPCFAGGAAKRTFTVTPATPAFAIGPPVTNSTCLSWSGDDSNGNSCSPNPKFVTSWAGNTYVQSANPVFISASVTSKVGTPTGTITFMQNGRPVDPSQGVNGAIPLNGKGLATFSLQNLPVGIYNLTAVYSGDVNYANQSNPLPTFQVIIPSVQVTQKTSGPVNITAGTPVQVTLSLMPLVGFSGDVTLECNSTDAPVPIKPASPTTMLPSYSQCTFMYANTVTGTSPVGKVLDQNGQPVESTIVVTISTNVPVNGGTSAAVAKRLSWSYAGLFGLGLLGLVAARKRARRFLAVICLAVAMSGALIGITACTNAGYSTPPPAPKVKTPAGTYNVQIISYDRIALQQNSLKTPVFTLPVTVQ